MTDKYGEIAPYYDMIYGTDIDYEAESRNLDEIFKNNQVQSVLDIGCGTASHLLHLARSGYHVAGIDGSEKMLETGRRKARRQKVEIDLVQGDMKQIKMAHTYDAVFSLYAFGLNAAGGDLKTALRTIYPLLNEKGILVFNIMNTNADWGDAAPGSPILTIDGVEDKPAGVKAVWIYQVRIRGNTQHMHAVYIIEDKEKLSMYTHNHHITSYGAEEITGLAGECGFAIESIHGSTTGPQAFDGWEPAMLVTARKIPGA